METLDPNELAALRRDSAWYRWLRDKAASAIGVVPMVHATNEDGCALDSSDALLTGEDLDAALYLATGIR